MTTPCCYSYNPAPLKPRAVWKVSRDGDPRVLRLYERHYSCRRYRDGRIRRLFVGPGEKLILITPQADALCAYRSLHSRDRQSGVNLAVFRNEGPVLSSVLIRASVRSARQHWPGERLYTYVDSRRVRSTNPGFSFIKADWERSGITQRGLLVLEARP